MKNTKPPRVRCPRTPKMHQFRATVEKLLLQEASNEEFNAETEARRLRRNLFSFEMETQARAMAKALEYVRCVILPHAESLITKSPDDVPF